MLWCLYVSECVWRSNNWSPPCSNPSYNFQELTPKHQDSVLCSRKSCTAGFRKFASLFQQNLQATSLLSSSQPDVRPTTKGDWPEVKNIYIYIYISRYIKQTVLNMYHVYICKYIYYTSLSLSLVYLHEYICMHQGISNRCCNIHMYTSSEVHVCVYTCLNVSHKVSKRYIHIYIYIDIHILFINIVHLYVLYK